MFDPGFHGLGAYILAFPPWAATTVAPSQKTLPDVLATFRWASVMSVKRGGVAAAWMRNRSYTAGNPFTQVPRVERLHVPPGQSALRPHCLPALPPPTHVPPSTSEKKPSPWPSSCRTTVTKSSFWPAFPSVP